MSERHVVVVGSGAAGTLAALAANAIGARVTMVCGKTGATSIGSGAIDGDIDDETKKQISAALTLYAFTPATLATNAGTLRKAHGHDLALANLDASSGAVLVARVAHASWDANALAASYAEVDARGFVARDVALVVHERERSMHHIELAALHDDPARIAIAAARIRESLAQGSFGAVLVPPWLGASAPRAKDLSTLVGVPCGEILVGEGGPAGVRFEQARDRSLQNTNISTLKTRAKRIETSTSRCTIETEDGATLEADAVVLATGGVLAGGITYAPRGPFALTYEAPVVLGRDGHPLVTAGSIFGVAPESVSWPYENVPLLERIGVMIDSRLRASDRIFACGDLLEGAPREPRTISRAFMTGAAAGRAAAIT